MLPQIFGESATKEAERQSNYLILRTLEERLPAPLFAQVLQEVSKKTDEDASKPADGGAMVLPQRVCWDGSKVESTFSDLKVSQRNLDDGYLPRVLLTMQELQKIQQQRASQFSVQQSLSKILNRNIDQKGKRAKNLAVQLRSRFSNQLNPSRRQIKTAQAAEFARMKTVFCHADFTTDEVSSIFNVQFDQTGRFIISGADDGVIKVWDRETLTLQASLHGHFDYITDIDISKCNRFIASAGKDAQIIIWDLKTGRIVKKLNHHTQLINRIQFVTPKIKKQQPAPGTERAASATPTQQTSVNDLQAQFKQMSIETQILGPETFQVQDQFLLSCSDDGTVRLYDFSPLSRIDPTANNDVSKGDLVSQEADELRIRRSNRRPDSRNNGPADPYADFHIFELELTPDGFRPGQRNKKLDTLCCTSQGLVLAGTNSGELFVWKVYFQEVQKQNSFNASKFLGCFKIQKTGWVQFMELSPKSDLLLIGSTDGCVRLFDLSLPGNRKAEDIALKKFTLNDNVRLQLVISEVRGCQKYNSLKFYNEEGEEEEQISVVDKPAEHFPNLGPKVSEVFVKSTCDSVKWSVHGRYAIASITSKLEKPVDALPEDPHEEICRIKVWDTQDETFIEDLSRPSGFLIKRNSWVLAPHPKIEEILLTGSDGGQLIIWNIKTKQLLQTFKQYGVYSIDQYVMDNPLDGKFSKDGHAFIIGCQLGTISLFSNENKAHQYAATRVQQFYPFDSAKQQDNPFEKMQNHPSVCGYNMIPYEVQPSKFLIGKQAQAAAEPKTIEQQAQENHEFERNLILAKELGLMEEKYYQDQIQLCIQQDLFLPGVLEEGSVQGPQESNYDAAFGASDIAMTSNRDDSVYDYAPYTASPLVIRPQRPAQNAGPRAAQTQQSQQQQPGRRPRLQRSALQDRQEVVDSNSSESDREEANSQLHEDSQFDEYEAFSDSSDSHSEEETKFQPRRPNVHDRFTRNRGRPPMQRGGRVQRESQESSDGPVRRRGRPRKRSPSEELDSDDREVINLGSTAPAAGRGRPTRAAAMQSSRPNGEARRRLFRNRGHESESEEESPQRNPRRRNGASGRINYADESNSDESSRAQRPTRTQRKRVDSDDAEMSEGISPDQIKLRGFYFSDREAAEEPEDSSPVLVNKKKEIDQAILNAKDETKHDRDYVFEPDRERLLPMLPQGYQFVQVCSFCNRADADEALTGPFCKYDSSKERIVGQPLFFHKDCIEKNKISRFNSKEKTWFNIGTALTALVHKYPQECFRCRTKGATIQCSSCPRWFHGFKCTELYCINLQTDELGIQCFFCLNKQNHETYQSALKKKANLTPLEACIRSTNEEYLSILKALPRDHTLTAKNPITHEHDSKKALTFIPQVGDLVYYFFQGHEEYATQYNIHHFSGLNAEVNRTKYMPWLTTQMAELRDQQQVLCKVTQIDSLFPSRHEIALMRQFGADSAVSQVPQILHQITLQVMPLDQPTAKQCIAASVKAPVTFVVDLFPNELEDFLVLQPVFEQRLKWYLEFVKTGSQGKPIKVMTKKGLKQMIITKDQDPAEPSLFGHSLWKNICCVDAFAGRGQRSSVFEMPSHRQSARLQAQTEEFMRISFWEIQFPEELRDRHVLEKSLNTFNGEQQSKLENALVSFLQQKSEFLYIFRERVREPDAPDYRSIIASEMYFDLVMQRIKNGYYRTQEEIESDLDKISFNATLYNGDENVIAQNAQKLCETFRMRIKQMVFQKPSDLLETHVDSALNVLKIARAELKSQNKGALSPQVDIQMTENRQRVEIIQSEEEEKKSMKRSVGRPPKNRVIESSSGSENKNPVNGLRKSRHEDTQVQNDVVINFDEAQTSGSRPAQRERATRLVMSASSNAQSAPASADIFAAPQQKGQMATRKRMRHEMETPTSGDKVSPSPSRPISEEQEAHVRSEGLRGNFESRQLRKRQKVE